MFASPDPFLKAELDYRRDRIARDIADHAALRSAHRRRSAARRAGRRPQGRTPLSG